MTHCWGVGGPAGRTHFSVSFYKLEGPHQAESLVHAAADWQVVHAHVPHYPIWVNDEQASRGRYEHSDEVQIL